MASQSTCRLRRDECRRIRRRHPGSNLRPAAVPVASRTTAMTTAIPSRPSGDPTSIGSTGCPRRLVAGLPCHTASERVEVQKPYPRQPRTATVRWPLYFEAQRAQVPCLSKVETGERVRRASVSSCGDDQQRGTLPRAEDAVADGARAWRYPPDPFHAHLLTRDPSRRRGGSRACPFKPSASGVLRIAGHQLIVVEVLVEVEGVARVVVDEAACRYRPLWSLCSNFRMPPESVHVIGSGRIRRLQRRQPAGRSLDGGSAFITCRPCSDAAGWARSIARVTRGWNGTSPSNSSGGDHCRPGSARALRARGPHRRRA